DLTARDISYATLRDGSERVAAGLADLGIGAGDRVGVLMGKSADLAVALLAIWRRGAVHVPLFTAFGPAAITFRLTACDAKLVITDADQRAKLDASDGLPAESPWRIVTAGGPGRDGDTAFTDLLRTEPSAQLEPAVIGGDGTFALIFTSGTTGAPKGVPWPVRGLAHLVTYLEYGCDVRAEDVYWNVADPGWAYGLGFAIVAPLAAGRRSILLHGGFTAELAWQVLARLKVTNLAAAPTVYRALRNAPAPEPVSLRCASSAGEPLTPELIPWADATLGTQIRDHYGQTEVGVFIVNGWHPDIQRPIKPGSMGYALPGWSVEVLLPDRDQPAPAGALGRIAVDRTSPLWAFPGYHHAPKQTAARISEDGRWYLTGDLAARDEDGALHFSSRDDDVILMAGYRIGPFEVESVLVEHPDVAEAAVIGVPDDLRGEVIEAFVVPRSGVTPSQEFTTALQQQVKTQFAAHAYPRAVHVVDALPKTPSGKIQRYMLRAQRHAEIAHGLTRPRER
ncbi:MAG: acetyl-CoA synthetase, partial [Pseudonocardiales bacterium]|nr:acetyl-CoA synthetase [Pseudonocardiales bacterium]